MNNKKRVNHSEENIYKTASNISYSQRSNKKHVKHFIIYYVRIAKKCNNV